MTSGAFSISIFLLGPLAMVAGRLNDKFGPRVLVTVCAFLSGLGYLLMSQIGDLWQLYLLYGVLIAAGMSGAFVPITSTVARWFVKRRGLMTGIVTSGVGAGVMVWPPLVSWFISNYGWRISYLMIGAIVLVLVITATQFLKRDPSKIGQIPYGDSELKQEVLVSEVRGFPFNEAVRTRQFWMLWVMYICFSFSQTAITVHIVPHTTDLGIPTIAAANILTIIGGVSIAGRIGIGSASDRIGNKLSIIIGLSVMSAALFWLLAIKELWMFYLFAAIYGFGYGSLISLASPIVAELFGMRAHGVILGTVTFAMSIGGAIGPIIAGHIFDITDSYYFAFQISGILSVTALVLVSLLKPTRREG